MNSTASKSALVRLVRGLTAILGLGLIAYAISDHPMYGGAPGFGTLQAVIVGLGCVLLLCTFLSFESNARVLLVSLSGLFALAILEISASVLIPLRPCYQEDELLLFKLLPDCSSVWYRNATNGGNRILQHVNSDGFRGAEIKQPASGLRVVVYGDSFIQAVFSPDEETFVAELENQFESYLQAPVEVINAGVTSYGPDQVSLRLIDDLNSLQPDIVIITIYTGNDYGDLLRNKLFRLDEEGNLEKNDGRLSQRVLDGFARRRITTESILKRSLKGVFNRWFSEEQTPYSYLGLSVVDTDPDVALMNFWLEMAEKEYQEYVIDGNNIVNNIFMDHYNADLSLLPGSDSAIYKVQLMNKILQRLKHTVAEAGVPLVLLFIPNPMNVTDEYDIGRVEVERFPDFDRRNLIAPLEEWARINEVHYVSLFDPYRKRDANDLYYHGGDSHWNAAGQKLAAEIMKQYLADNGLLEPVVR